MPLEHNKTQPKKKRIVGLTLLLFVAFLIFGSLAVICACIGLYIHIISMIPFIHVPYSQLVILLDNLTMTSPYILQPQYTYYDFFLCSPEPLIPIKPYVKSTLEIELHAAHTCHSFNILPEVVYTLTIIVPFEYDTSVSVVAPELVPQYVDVFFASIPYPDYVSEIGKRTSTMPVFPSSLKSADWNVAQLNYSIPLTGAEVVRLQNSFIEYWDSFTAYRFDRKACPENTVCQVSICLNDQGKEYLSSSDAIVDLVTHVKIQLFDLTNCRPLQGTPNILLNLHSDSNFITRHSAILVPDHIDIQFSSGKVVGQVSNNIKYYQVSKIWGLSGQAIAYFTSDRFFYAARIRNALLGCFLGIVLGGILVFTIVVLLYQKKPVPWKLYLWTRMIDSDIACPEESENFCVK